MFLLTPLSDSLRVNGLELSAALAIWLIIVNCARRKGKNLAYALVVSLPLLVPITASVERDTQFMTIDETGITNLLLNPADRAQGQIAAGAFRTTLPLAVHAVRLMQTLGVAEDRIRMFLKIYHWMVGASLLLVIYFLLAKLGGWDASNPAILLFSITSLFAFPMTNITLKTFNYDLISSLGSIVAILLTMIAFSDISRTKFVTLGGAIVTATLAAQEKLSASPILCLVLLAPALLIVRRFSERSITVAVLATLGGILLSLSISTIFTFVYVAAFAGLPSSGIWSGIPDAISSWTWIAMRLLSGGSGGQVPNRAAAFGIAVAFLVGMAAALPALNGRLKCLKSGSLGVNRLPSVTAGLMFVGLGTGLLSTALLQPYWAPFHPSPIGHGFAMNGIWLHFGLDSSMLTRIAYVGYAFEILLVAMPTPILLVCLFANVALLASRREYDFKASSLVFIGLSLTLAGALLQVPLAHRYLDIPLFLILTASLLVTISRAREYFLRTGSRTLPLMAATILSVATIFETAPFRPLYAAFRPFWLNYGDAKFAEAGRLNPSWLGWGEERALVGEKFEQLCHRSPEICRGAIIYHLYFGRWLPERSRPFEILDASQVAGKEPLGDRDYYLFNRSKIVQGLPQPKSRPILTLDFRGYQMAWLYRGSDLAAENYRFGR